MITIRLVRPGEDMNVVVKVYRRQSQSYALFSAEKAVYTPTEEEIADGSVYYIVAHELGTGELCGGLRIHVRSSDAPLPLNVRYRQLGSLRSFAPSPCSSFSQRSGCWVLRYLRQTALQRVDAGGDRNALLGIHRVLAFTHEHVPGFLDAAGFLRRSKYWKDLFIPQSALPFAHNMDRPRPVDNG